MARDVFISYRRGSDGYSADAGRVSDLMRAQGVSHYYDLDPKANQTGEPFPETIASALKACRVVVAVIDRPWLAQAVRLQDPRDWVRQELLAAAPGSGRVLLPIYLNTSPREVSTALPPALAFVGQVNSHFLWQRFEGDQQRLLVDRLRELLPDSPVPEQSVSDVARLELLCDRSRAEAEFERLVMRTGSDARGWLLLGESDQGHAQLFERIMIYTLKESWSGEFGRRPHGLAVHLNDFANEALDTIEQHILTALMNSLGASWTSEWPTALLTLARRPAPTSLSLLFIHGSVKLTRAQQVLAWVEHHEKLVRRLRAAYSVHQHDSAAREATSAQSQSPLPCIVLALSLEYERTRGAWAQLLSSKAAQRLLGTRPSRLLPANAPQRELARLFPHLFQNDDEEPVTSPEAEADDVLCRRLLSARADHIRDWCQHAKVRAHIRGREAMAKELFGDGVRTLPMEHVLDHLGRVLEPNALTRSTGAT
ncbi:toll/interleukin-1 receptor domain-containing protein [Variovorax sp. J22R115]|uniref:toll/interleukin-1 receptor domain-containing protein n=1 Tax=Variovorax sp. J22R115 TaxID=3053509 RepID=UPI0025752C48|nr:toll/interleukin-1 receptor domain-containing protein [Variovorax sp. J22R115]MDM0053549.1 toll/interleukin-1 receptor domain-containing protein [Variovorax sp. J22R115]